MLTQEDIQTVSKIAARACGKGHLAQHVANQLQCLVAPKEAAIAPTETPPAEEIVEDTEVECEAADSE